ncbi:hypothetical protein ATY81_26630 [Rhizobium sp. R72]|nr:hypothetical protein ATY81_26630 [Rhizobium sp. R72]OWV98970.1 hypothetical protein ATY80_26630 [Rhizobium sp. R711]
MQLDRGYGQLIELLLRNRRFERPDFVLGAAARTYSGNGLRAAVAAVAARSSRGLGAMVVLASVLDITCSVSRVLKVTG